MWVMGFVDFQCAKSRSSSRAQMGARRNSSGRAQVVRNDGKEEEEEENNLVCVGPFGAFVAVAVPGSNLFPVPAYIYDDLVNCIFPNRHTIPPKRKLAKNKEIFLLAHQIKKISLLNLFSCKLQFEVWFGRFTSFFLPLFIYSSPTLPPFPPPSSFLLYYVAMSFGR